MLNHPWIKSGYQPVPPEVYDDFVPQVKAFCQYTPLHRAALVAYAFCMPSKHIRKHSDVYNELNVAHVRTTHTEEAVGWTNTSAGRN